MLELEDIEIHLQNDHPKMIKLLILLAYFDVPVKVKDMDKAAKEAGFKVPRAWNFETILKSGGEFASKGKEGWSLTDKGFAHLHKLDIRAGVLPPEEPGDA